jgi:hypothetical protein
MILKLKEILNNPLLNIKEKSITLKNCYNYRIEQDGKELKIFIDRDLPEHEKICLIAHELAHISLNHSFRKLLHSLSLLFMCGLLVAISLPYLIIFPYILKIYLNLLMEIEADNLADKLVPDYYSFLKNQLDNDPLSKYRLSELV